MDSNETQTPAAPAQTTPRKRRWLPRLRFSLRTLIIFVLLVGSAGGLWWRWEPWYLNAALSEEISAHPAASLSLRDRLTAPDSVRAILYEDGSLWNVRNHELQPLYRFFPMGKPNTIIPRGFIDDDTVVFAWIQWKITTDKDGNRVDAVDTGYRVYSRRRPEYWWGIAWLPEFWMTLVFSVGLFWSVWRDRRSL
ncbi:MAG TPA: hypothetical protein VGP72_22915 [Planctomycetota bacterium]|jgi:hypothetical protein